MIGSQGVRRVRTELTHGIKLIRQNLEHQTRIQFRIVHMSRRKAAIMVMFDQVVIRVARKCERVQP